MPKGKKKDDYQDEPLPPIRQTFVSSTTAINDTVVNDGKPYYIRFDFKTQAVEALDYIMRKDGRMLVPLHSDDSLIGFVRFPSTTEEYGTESDLFAEIRRYIRKWVDLEEKYEILATLYVLFTYAYDDFLEVPYLRILADLGSGKTRLGVDVLGTICYKAFSTIAVSTLSPIFRTLDFLGGTMILDEADLEAGSEKSSEIVQVLNSGYRKGLCVLRSEMSGRGFRTVQYKTFGPKIIISREHFKDAALESRCLEIRMKHTTRKDIPFLLDETLEDEGAVIRNKLLLWRFRSYGSHRKNIDYSFADLNLPPRLKQLLLLISGVVRDPSMMKMLKDLGQKLHEENAERRSDSFEGDIIQYLAAKGHDTFISCAEIAESINENLASKDQKTAKSIGWYLRERLALSTTKGPHPGRRRGIIVSKEDLKMLCDKYGVDFMEFGAAPDGAGGQAQAF